MQYKQYTVPDPFFNSSNVYRIGNTLIDTGSIPSSSNNSAPIEEVVDNATMDSIERVIITHPHIDHVGGSETSRLLSRLPHVVYHGAQTVLSDFEAYLDGSLADWRLVRRELPPDNHLADFSWPKLLFYNVHTVRTVTNDETVWIDDEPFEVIHTPGHNQYHMALYHKKSNTAITGDAVLPHGYYIRGPHHSNVTVYEASLQRLRSLKPSRLLPGHGEVIKNPIEVIDKSLSKSEEIRRSVRKTVSDTPITLKGIVNRLLEDDDDGYKRLVFTMTVFAYIEEMVRTGDAYINYTDRLTIQNR